MHSAGLAILALLVAVSLACMTSTSAAEPARFECFRALVIAPGAVWQAWDSAIYGALEERGFSLTTLKDLPGTPLADSFDLVAVNAERRLTDAQQDALARFVSDGGAVYVSYEEPCAWGRDGSAGSPRFFREIGKVSAARATRIREIQLPASVVWTDPTLARCALKTHVGCFKATDEGWSSVALEPLADATTVMAAPNGAALGVLSEHGRGRVCIMGFPPEQEKYLENPDLGPALLDNLLAWLLESKLREGPRPLGFITLAIPARAEVMDVLIDGKRFPDPLIRQVGSLKKIRMDTTAWPEGQAREVRITYRPLSAARNVQTVIHMPWGVLRGAADSPAGLADYLASMGATTCQPLLRAANGRAWYKGMPEDSPDDKLVTNYKGDFLADAIRECRARDIRFIAGVYLDSNTPLRRYPETQRVDRQGKPVKDSYGQPAACFNNPKAQEHNLATIDHLLSNYKVDGLVLDDNFYLDYSDMYACYCDYCKDAFRRWCEARGARYADPATVSAGHTSNLWWEHKREATRGLAARVRQIAAAHGVPAGGWVSNGIGMTHLAAGGAFDFLGEMTYSSPPRAMRGPLSALGDHHLICLLWEPDVPGDQLEREVRQAVFAGCASVGFWTGQIAQSYKAPTQKFDSMKRAFNSVEQWWREYYKANILEGDPRFEVLAGSAGPQELRLRITRAKSAAGHQPADVDLSLLP